MKRFYLLAAVVLLLATNAVSYYLGRQSREKDYEAACLQADFIRFAIDSFNGETYCANIGSEIEELWYETYQDLDMGIYNTKHITDIKDFESYGWWY